MRVSTSDSRFWPSVNSLTTPLVSQLLADAGSLRLAVEQHPGGATIVDAGIRANRFYDRAAQLNCTHGR